MADNSQSLLSMPGLASATTVDYLTPQQAQALANIAYAPEEQDQLSQQIQQAAALRQTPQPTYRTPLAAALGGAGDLINRIRSFNQENKLRGQQADLLSQQKTEFGDYLKQLAMAQQLRNGAPQQAPQQMPSNMPPQTSADLGLYMQET